jgi:hypothetical protein
MSTQTIEPSTIILDNSEIYAAEKAGIAQESAKRSLAISSSQESFFQQMLSCAKDIDLDKLKQLQAMHEHAQDREAERLFDIDFVAMRPELPLVIKLHDNTQTKSKYAKIEDINKLIDPILGKFGFGTSMKVMEQSAAGVTVRVFLRHKAGHKEFTDVYMPLDDKGIKEAVNKTGPHAHSSSISYAIRVGKCLLLNISTGNDKDGNIETDADAPIPNEVAVALDMRINKLSDATEYKPRFLKYMKYAAIPEIKNKDFKKALTAVELKEKEAQKAGAK